MKKLIGSVVGLVLFSGAVYAGFENATIYRVRVGSQVQSSATPLFEEATNEIRLRTQITLKGGATIGLASESQPVQTVGVKSTDLTAGLAGGAYVTSWIDSKTAHIRKMRIACVTCTGTSYVAVGFTSGATLRTGASSVKVRNGEVAQLDYLDIGSTTGTSVWAESINADSHTISISYWY